MTFKVSITGCLRLGLALLLTASMSHTAAEPEPEPEPEPEQAYTGGVVGCLKCHDKQQHKSVLHTPHALVADERTPFAENFCEGCHGPSLKHSETSKKDKQGERVPIEFGKNSHTPIAEQNKVCLDCHRGESRIHWEASSHHNADVSCASCHDSHDIRDAVLERENQAEVCFDCHPAVRAKSNLFSRHPLKEGKIACSSCHQPHGGFGPSQLVGNTVNDTCYQCHAEKRGPFLWEHAPVREDCTTCHAPHGSTQPGMLKMRGPWLCQTCHSWEFHPGTLYDGNTVPPGATGTAVDRHVAFRNCLNCHPKIHGSNHPSGTRFTR